jgi:hypothetical protein
MIDTRSYYEKLARKESLSENEVLDLLRELEHFRGSLAYLASCQAATLEGLPKSYSKSGRSRHVELCKIAAAMLKGDGSRVRYPENMEAARNHCERAVERHEIG